MNNHPVVRIAFLDVGKGDTAVISLPETKEAVIVDCVDANVVMNYLEQEDIRYLRGLLITHLHTDHFGGAVQFLDNVERELKLRCERVLFHVPRLTKSLREAILYDADRHADGHLDPITRQRKHKNNQQELLRWAQSHKDRCKRLALEPDFTLPLAEVIELIHPWGIDIPDLLASGLNNTSAVIKVNGFSSSVLLTGDIEPSGWAQIDKSRLQSDVLKFPHHGAWRDDDIGQILDVVEPSFVVISVGTSSIQYGHPNTHVFEAIAQRPDVRLFCTQVTTQCSIHVDKVRAQVIDAFRQQSDQDDDFFFTEQRGCPCAGTIIIELSDSVHVIQPHAAFHQDEIINRYYNEHQCNVQD